MRKMNPWNRTVGALGQAWAIAAKDLRTYYFNPPMLMFGLIMPVLLFFSFSMRRGAELSPQMGVMNLTSMILFFTASTAGPVILILERRTRTLDRLMTAPLSMSCLLFGKMLVGMVFAVGVALVPLIIGLAVFQIKIQNPVLLAGAIVLSAMSFSALGVWFGSFPARSVGTVMMPSTLLRWPLLFVSGIFIPLNRMPVWARTISRISPLTYAHDAITHAINGSGVQPAALDMLILPVFLIIFLFLAVRLYRRVRRLGY
jgi:ABC-2 type transport system permease protein